MPRIDDKSLAVAQVYSESLLGLAEAQGDAEGVLDQLTELTGLMEKDEAFRHFVSTPLADTDRRRESLETLFRGRATDLVVDSLQVLNRRGRLDLLPAIAETYRRQLRALRGIVLVEVRSAQALSEALRGKLRAALEAHTGRGVILEEKVDPGLIGGIVLQVGDRKFDGSVATKLARLKRALQERGSREIERGTLVEGTAGEG